MLLLATVSVLGLPPSEPTDSQSIDYDPDTAQIFLPLPKWRKALLACIFPIARSILFVSLGVYNIRSDRASFKYRAHDGKDPEKAYVIVANHLGYIDILVLLCMFKGSFVAKGELEHTPIIGYLARALHCMFVRKGQSLTTQLVARIQSTHVCHKKRVNCPGCPPCMSKLVIFPEGTTTNGTAMVPFRTGVFNAGLPVKPICIRFPYKRFNLSWETIRFKEHLFRTMTQFTNHVHLTELPVYEPSEEEIHDARLFARNVQREMGAVLEQPIVVLNRKHKFLYHSWILGKEKSEQDVIMKANDMLLEDKQLVYYQDHMGDENV